MDASDIDRISRLRDQWFSASSEFESDFNLTLDSIGFTEKYVNTMIADSDAGKIPRASKVIKDNTWGMIEVDWMSVRLLDSPILQRLRAVKQLGFSYLTYPSAEHSRFIHSLGMYAVVSRFLDAMLGYGNARNLIATYLNVPTSTFTCFWHPGMFNRHPWMPFTIRRGHLSRLIVA